MKRKAMVTMTLAVILLLPLAGCATKGKLSAARLCAGAGGKYNQQSQTCDQPARSNRLASEMCEAHGGYYDSTAQTCEVGLE